MKIVADSNIPFLKGIAEHFGTTEYLAGPDFNHESIKDADTLIVRTVTHFDESLLKDTKVKLLCTATIGFDHIDTNYCDSHNIVWKNAPGCNSSSVQQYIISSLLVLAYKKGFCLKDRTIGIVGVGNVGKKVAKACEALGMRVLLNDPPREKVEGSRSFVSLDTITQEADIITFHTPLTKDGEYKTYHLADANFFSSLKKHAIIINSARGSIIDTTAIKEVIRNRKIEGAIIDCWENEPNIDLEYLDMVDIATPHIAGYSADGKANATRMSLNSIAEFYKMDKTILDKVQPPKPNYSTIDLNEFDTNKRIQHAIWTTYDPMGDYQRLTQSPNTFKDQRNNYPFRREGIAYTVLNAKDEEKRLLKELGFNCL